MDGATLARQMHGKLCSMQCVLPADPKVYRNRKTRPDTPCSTP